MNKNDVLLTPSDRETLCRQCTGYGECDSAICQKHLPLQCLKLLKWLRDECVEQSHYVDIHEMQHLECDICIAELEQLLKS